MELPRVPPPRPRSSGSYVVLPEFVIKKDAWDWLRAVGVSRNLIKALPFFIKIYSHSLKARRPIFFTLGYISNEYPSFIREMRSSEATKMADETARRFLIWCVKRGLIYKRKDENEWFSKYFIDLKAMNFLLALIQFAHAYSQVMRDPTKRLKIDVVQEVKK